MCTSDVQAIEQTIGTQAVGWLDHDVHIAACTDVQRWWVQKKGPL